MIRKLALAVALAATAILPAAAEAQVMPTATKQAANYGRYWAISDWATRWGYTLTAWQFDCNDSAYTTPNQYQCWFTMHYRHSDGSAHYTACAMMWTRDYPSGAPYAVYDGDGPWVPTNTYPNGARGYMPDGTGMWAQVNSTYRLTAGGTLRSVEQHMYDTPTDCYLGP